MGLEEQVQWMTSRVLFGILTCGMVLLGSGVYHCAQAEVALPTPAVAAACDRDWIFSKHHGLDA